MHISNRFVIVSNNQIVIRMLYHSFETLLLLSFFYLMVRSGKSSLKIGSQFPSSPFLFILSKFPTPPPPVYSDSAAYLILPNVPTPSPPPPLIISPPCLFGTQE